MSFYLTPKRAKPSPLGGEGTGGVRVAPVFKTPMTFSPRSDQVRPSPSKFDVWKQQLGLDDTIAPSAGDGSDDDDDMDTLVTPSSSLAAGVKGEGARSEVEYTALLRELEERNTQRDELLLRIKTLTERSKSYKLRLEREETARKQQMRIMRKTHETHLKEKQTLVRNLEDVIEEQEARIATLNAHINGESPLPASSPIEPSPMRALVEQIQTLQQDHAELTQRLLVVTESNAQQASSTAAAEGENSSLDQQAAAELQARLNGLLEENARLRQRVEASTQSNGTTDTEKQLHVLEAENDSLKAKLRQQEMENASLAQQIAHVSELEAKIEKLKAENRLLQEQLEVLRQEMAGSTSSSHQREDQLKAQVKQLTEDSQKSAREVRELTAKLVALQAKSPEVPVQKEEKPEKRRSFWGKKRK